MQKVVLECCYSAMVEKKPCKITVKVFILVKLQATYRKFYKKWILSLAFLNKYSKSVLQNVPLKTIIIEVLRIIEVAIKTNSSFLALQTFSIIKQNDINKKLQKFTCKPHLAWYLYSFAAMVSLTLRYRLVIQNFVTS